MPTERVSVSRDAEYPSVWVMTLSSGPGATPHLENRFNPTFVESLHCGLDQVLSEHATVAAAAAAAAGAAAASSSSPSSSSGSKAATDSPCALVITGSPGSKFFSNGVDIAWLTAAGRSLADAVAFLRSLYRFFGRLLAFPVPTVAAINGHAFAGGCLLALCADYRVMRTQRGFVCMNEMDMPPGPAAPGKYGNADQKVAAILRAKVADRQVLRDLLLDAKRFPAEAALAAGIVDDVAPPEELVPRAVALAASRGRHGRVGKQRTLGVLKGEVYRDALEVLMDMNEGRLGIDGEERRRPAWMGNVVPEEWGRRGLGRL